MTWLNEPGWQISEGELRVVTLDQTDFWQRTHYGFVHDNGHFLHGPPTHDFTAQVRFQGEYQALYDQAGLMLRTGQRHWIKAGVEFVGEQQLSAVVTRDWSDWSVRPAGRPEYLDLKMTRRAGAISVQYRLPGAAWALLRLAYFPPELSASPGVYACSPRRAGFEVVFSDFRVGPAEEAALY